MSGLGELIAEQSKKMDDATIEELANDEGMRADMHGCAPWTPGVNHYLFDATKYGETHLEPVSTPDKFDELMSDLEGKWVVPLSLRAEIPDEIDGSSGGPDQRQQKWRDFVHVRPRG